MQDATYSFFEEFDDAIDADLDLVASMAGTLALPGDRVGLVRFARHATELLPLTDLSENASAVVLNYTLQFIAPEDRDAVIERIRTGGASRCGRSKALRGQAPPGANERRSDLAGAMSVLRAK